MYKSLHLKPKTTAKRNFKRSRAVVLSQLSIPGDIWQYLKTRSVVTTEEADFDTGSSE